MAESKLPSEQGMGYGYASDNREPSPFSFGLNAGVTFLKKFEWIPNGGTGGSEREALDIVFSINGKDKSYRMFPVIKGFAKNTGAEVTDPNSPEYKDALTGFNARIVHILHCFRGESQIKAAFSRPIASFKEFCNFAAAGLPKNFSEIPLDIFLQFQWNISEGQTRTFLDIPTKMKHGRWICTAVQPVGSWKETRKVNPPDTDREALFYTDDSGNKHPFSRTGWFVNNRFANQQSEGGSQTPSTTNGNSTSGAGQSQTPQANQNTSQGQAAAW